MEELGRLRPNVSTGAHVENPDVVNKKSGSSTAAHTIRRRSSGGRISKATTKGSRGSGAKDGDSDNRSTTRKPRKKTSSHGR